jgi:RNA polymerase sigma factor (sigma-70 family)
MPDGQVLEMQAEPERPLGSKCSAIGREPNGPLMTLYRCGNASVRRYRAVADGEPGVPPTDGQRSVRERDFEAAVRAEQQALARLAYLLCGNGTEAEDAVAETFARVWQRVTVSELDDIRPYLRRTLVNLLSRQNRRRSSERQAVVRHGAPLVTADMATAVTSRRDVVEALLSLPMELRAVVVLRYYADASEEEIAETLRIPRGTVKSRAARALELLCPRFQGEADA